MHTGNYLSLDKENNCVFVFLGTPTYLLEQLKWKIVTIQNAGKDVDKLGHSSTADGNTKSHSHSEKQFGGFFKD